MITTKILTDPKPATPLDRHGNPIREGYDYYGNPVAPQDTVSRAVEAPVARPDASTGSGQRGKRQKKRRTAEQRAAISAKIKAFWAAKRNATVEPDRETAPDAPQST